MTATLQNEQRKLGILGVPLGFGAGKSGSELGVEAIRLSRVRGAQLASNTKETNLNELAREVEDQGKKSIYRTGALLEPQSLKRDA